MYTALLASKLPCPIERYTWTKDHVCPKSLFPRAVTSNPTNIIPMPKRLNHARGNLKFTDKWNGGVIKYACDACPHPGYCRGAGVVSGSGFMPPDVFKGEIARSVLMSIAKYPKMSEKISDEVLDYETAIKWDRLYPATDQRLVDGDLPIGPF